MRFRLLLALGCCEIHDPLLGRLCSGLSASPTAAQNISAGRYLIIQLKKGGKKLETIEAEWDNIYYYYLAADTRTVCNGHPAQMTYLEGGTESEPGAYYCRAKAKRSMNL